MSKKLKGNTILIVEDDIDIQLFVSEVLELEGYHVLRTGTGTEGLKLLQNNNIGLLLLDLRLPDMSGWGILEHVKNEPETSVIPVVLFTASVGVPQRERALSMGAAEYLEKPLSAADLRDTVAHVLES